MKRRRFLAGTVAAGTVALAGCSNVRPAPTVVNSTAESQLFGPTTFDIVVENDGASGEVKVLLTIYGKGGTVQSKHDKTVSMESGAKREVTFKVDIENEAEKYTAEAKPAGFL